MDSRLHQAHLRSTNNIRSSPAIPFRNSPSPSPNLNPFTSKPQIPPLAPDQKHRRGPDFSRTTNLSSMQGERPSAQSSAARPVSSDLRSKTVQFSKGTLDVLAKASEILQKSSKITIGSTGGPPTASSIPIDRSQFEKVTPTSVQTQNFSAKTSNALGKADEILKKSLGYTRDSRVSAGKGGESSSRPHETAKTVFENNTHNAMVERNEKLHHTHVPVVAKASSDDQEKKLHNIFSRIDQTLQRSLQITNNSFGPTPTANLGIGNSNVIMQAKPVIHHERPRQNHFETPPATQLIDRTLRTDYQEKKDHVSSYQETQKLIPEILRNEHEKLSKTLPARKAENELAPTTHMKSSFVMERRQNIESNSPFGERKTAFTDNENNKEIAPQQAVPLPIRIKKPKFVEEDYEDGTVYKGEKIREAKHGRGEILYPDGSRYEGEWENDIKNGYGVQTFPNGNIEYDGEWKDDNYHGNGVLMNENARENRGFSCQDFDTLENNWTKYEGEFLNGKMHGLGTLTLFNNERYVGKFKNDKVHGVGVFHMRNGDTVSAQWENNKLIRA